MQALIKRSKVFSSSIPVSEVTDAAGNKIDASKPVRYFAPKSENPQNIPEWARNTLTFKVGVVDGSIVELVTPAKSLPAGVGTDAGDEKAPVPADTGSAKGKKGQSGSDSGLTS